jgi:hypothetical protein
MHPHDASNHLAMPSLSRFSTGAVNHRPRVFPRNAKAGGARRRSRRLCRLRKLAHHDLGDDSGGFVARRSLAANDLRFAFANGDESLRARGIR